ncbi:MAG TPA: hypothetical protein VGJ85_05285, partial [Candidatus Nanopelagicaceae bacterium]
FCTGFWLTRSSWLPRPASPDSTSKVETVHPHDWRLKRYYIAIQLWWFYCLRDLSRLPIVEDRSGIA